MKNAMLFVALFTSAVMAQSGPLPNGVYAIEKASPHAKTHVVRQHEGKDVVLDTANFAPLKVSGKPEVHRGTGGSWLAVQLAPEAAKRLEELTRPRINQPIAVVVGDRILSAPTVRSAITDGKAQLTPCDSASCERLLAELSK